MVSGKGAGSGKAAECQGNRGRKSHRDRLHVVFLVDEVKANAENCETIQ